jgi:hypothetical protein
MVPILRVTSVFSCGFLLCLGQSNVAQASNVNSAKDEMAAGQSHSCGGQMV